VLVIDLSFLLFVFHIPQRDVYNLMHRIGNLEPCFGSFSTHGAYLLSGDGRWPCYQYDYAAIPLNDLFTSKTHHSSIKGITFLSHNFLKELLNSNLQFKPKLKNHLSSAAREADFSKVVFFSESPSELSSTPSTTPSERPNI